MTQETILNFLSSYAYEPLFVYTFIICFLTASSFGLPVPEELVLVSAGLLGYFSLNPDKYPPPFPGAPHVDPETLAAVCLLAVFLSDLLVYWLGRLFGGRVKKSKRFGHYFQNKSFQKVERLMTKHGAWLAGFFRFTPGLRFPGHFACGFLGVSHGKFWLFDGTAALISVPTQVLLVSYFGETILTFFKQFKISALVVIALLVLAYFYFRPRIEAWLLKD